MYQQKHITSIAGFSLTEMMVAIGILAMMSVIAAPFIVGQMPGFKMRQAVQQLAADLQATRMQAISENTTAQVSFEASRKQYTLWIDRNRDGARSREEERLVKLPRDRHLTLYTYPTEGTFDARGLFHSDMDYMYIRLWRGDTVPYFLYVYPNGEVDELKH